jgi:hypothetical protein
MNTITLNSKALSSFGESVKVRVQNREGTLYLRPTDRKSGVNLPKGEKLADLSRKGDTGQITVEGVDVPASGALGLRADKYGWLAIAGSPARGEASVKVA